ncbi:MAG TPA: metallophosphoesterase family protein [Dehalococcoidia bacterium]
MRVLVVSDVHANLAALEAVLRDARTGGAIDAVWSLGDCVGYGPQPGECLLRLSDEGVAAVAGNHERAATGAISVDDFNPDARTAALWTADRLAADEKASLDAMPETRVEAEHFSLVHGTLRQPVWEYLYSVEAGAAHLALQKTPFGFCGHTHVPAIVSLDADAPGGCDFRRLADGESVPLDTGTKVVINPGSVGQPRDGDARASYAVYESEAQSVTVRRVEYDIGSTQGLMEEAGLPRWLIERLSEGR